LAVLELKISDAVTLAVPATLESITTYVLLEQESWFEKEMDFLRHWLQPGMTVIDIGANLGVYSLPAARLVGPTGQVFAYEPGSESRALLERSRELNAAFNLHISPLALSDRERKGHLVFGASSELNELGESGAGEAVSITSLDNEDASRDGPPPDFVKIDAEGEEERILAGGRKFFSRHSPLVMFEIKAGDKVNQRLQPLFLAIGYRLFRQLGGAPILVSTNMQQPLDQFELNLFAAKPDRVSTLSRQGLLVDAVPAWAPTEDDCRVADTFWQSQRFAPLVRFFSGTGMPMDVGYRDCLAAYAVWRTSDRPATRCAALAFAFHGLRNASARAPTAARLSTFARVAWEWGARTESVAVLQHLLQAMRRGQLQLNEPFWPPCPRFESIAPTGQPADWFAGAVAEQFELTSAYSSIFTRASPVLQWLCSQSFATPQMERRRVLHATRAGQRPAVPARLTQVTPDHLNAEIWGTGKVPGTVIGPLKRPTARSNGET
jgi:FkbM family methyltransferase